MCNEQRHDIDQKTIVHNCKLYVRQTVKPGQIAFTHLVKSPYHGKRGSIFKHEATSIENDALRLSFQKKEHDKHILKFDLQNKLTGEVEPLEFSLDAYHSYGKWGDEGEAEDVQKSGAYIFKPVDNQTSPFTQLHSCHAHIGATHQELVFDFRAGTKHNEGSAFVIVSLEDLAVVKFEVKLYGLPKVKEYGQEVTVSFTAPNLDNDRTFYTDSNGL